MASLEEWLQQQYVQYYTESENYVNKVELLDSKIPNLLLKNSATRKYVVYKGKAYYLLNKEVLPSKIRDGLIGGNTTEISDFTKLIDVYGITPNLEVYYCENGLTERVYGNLESGDINLNTPLTVLNNSSNSAIKNVVADALAQIGIEVDEELGITIGNVASLTELIIDGTTCSIRDCSALSDLTALRKLTFKNLTLDSLDGIENLPFINYVYFYNCDLADYSKLATAYNLIYLYFYFPDTMNETRTNYQITNLGSAFHEAINIKNLQYLYIVGDLNIYSEDYTGLHNWKYPSENLHRGLFTYKSETASNLSDISGLGNFSSNIKSSIIELYMNCHKITSISALSNFSNLNNVLIMNNSSLTSLTGLENKKNLLYLGASGCSFTNLDGISGDNSLIYLTIFGNSNLEEITGVRTCSSLVGIYGDNCTSLTSLEGLGGDIKDNNGNYTGLDNLNYIRFENCNLLENVGEISLCDNILNLFIGGCLNLNKSDVRNLESIIVNCGEGKYSINSKFKLAFSSTTSLSFSGRSFSNDDLEELRDLTNIKILKLDGCTALSNSKIDSVLTTMIGLEYLSFKNCSGLTSIDFVDYMSLKELDLHGTNVTDLTKLNDSSSQNLKSLRVSRKKVTITNYSTLILNIFNNGSLFSGMDGNSTINKSWYASSGLMLTDWDSNLQNTVEISIPSTLTSSEICIGSFCQQGVIFDFSKCNSISGVKFSGGGSEFICPSSVTWVHNELPSSDPGLGVLFDFSLCSLLTTYEDFGFASDTTLSSNFSTLPELNRLNSIEIRRGSLTNLSFLVGVNLSSLKSLKISRIFGDGKKL